MLIGKEKAEYDEFFLAKFYGALKALQFRDEDSVVNFVGEYVPSFESQGIVATGFSGLEFPPGQNLFTKIQNETGLPVFQAPSHCHTAGVARAEAPYLEIFTIPSEVRKIIKKLKKVKVFWDLEFHFIGSNINQKKENSCIKVNILERESILIHNIITYLREVGFKREQIWINIIHDFISARKMKL